MRVLHLNTYYAKVGGAEVYLGLLVDTLRERGHDVAVFGFDPEQEIDEERVRVLRRPEFVPAGLVRDEELSESLLTFARAFDPELIHVHNLSAYPAELALVLRSLDRPMLQTVHDFSLLCPNSWCVLPSGVVCEGGPGRKCFEHGCQENAPYDARMVTAAHLRLSFVRDSFQAFLCPSQFLADKLVSHGYQNVEKLPYWADVGSPSPAPGGAQRDRDHVLFMGRLVKEKGVRTLIEAFPRVLARRPSARLSIVGDGPEGAALRALCSKLGLDSSVDFHGRVPHTEVQRFYAAATLQVLPSIWCENSPVTTYESLIFGLPMLASRIAGLPEMVVEGETGLLASPGDPIDFADRIVQILGDRALQDSLSAGCARALERYSKERHLKRLLEVYDEVVARPRGAAGREHTLEDEDLIATLDAFCKQHASFEDWAAERRNAPLRKLGRHLFGPTKDRLDAWRKAREE